MAEQSNSIDVGYVANLARLHLTDAEKEVFQGQLEHIVEYVRKIGQLDLDGIEPTSHARPMTNVFRADSARPGLDRDDILANAPSQHRDQFQVPRIVE